MKILRILYVILLLETGCSSSGNKNSKNGWEVTKVEGKTLFFKNRKKFTTTLYDLKYIGQLKTTKKAPFLILSGRGCDECDANTSIYIHSPNDGKMKEEAFQARYQYPGKLSDYETNQLIYESRMFYGNCLNDKNDCVVWLQNFIDDKKHWKQSAFIVEVINDTLKEYTIERNLPDIQSMLKCGTKELKGEDQGTEP